MIIKKFKLVVFFSFILFIHIICNFFYERDFSYFIIGYVFLFLINSFFLLFFFIFNKKPRSIISLYVIETILKLFFSIFFLFYLIMKYDISNMFVTFINFVFSYFLVLFFKIILLLN